MATQEANKTKDHDTIKNWVEERDGRPAVVKDTEELLRIDFQEKDDQLEEIEWDQFFEIFDSNNIEFLYQEEKKDGEKSTFCKFVSAN
ncbi:hypothetical protein NBT05_06335 [Aquimarina sp. ERC-38]|uniref:hypothetical protein n=1 Tax=Aquimarina sp. ERC-38 TaxID=2949996 RepID=UPI00224734EB|nr:hypothetical protein [Aquimarina sp. ERC-38]UZO82086.1 hypothetical protein NBT05_06335 [Aquimarina sp. ERC-38]